MYGRILTKNNIYLTGNALGSQLYYTKDAMAKPKVVSIPKQKKITYIIHKEKLQKPSANIAIVSSSSPNTPRDSAPSYSYKLVPVQQVAKTPAPLPPAPTQQHQVAAPATTTTQKPLSASTSVLKTPTDSPSTARANTLPAKSVATKYVVSTAELQQSATLNRSSAAHAPSKPTWKKQLEEATASEVHLVAVRPSSKSLVHSQKRPTSMYNHTSKHYISIGGL